MKISIISVTERGRKISGVIGDIFNENNTVTRYAFHKYTDDNSFSFANLGDISEKIFKDSDTIVFICSVGIAVRTIAPYIKSKITDPAVIAMDEQGKFVIPVLSGHLGGANHITRIIAENTGATPVITTATDVGGKFSPDCFAKANNLLIYSMNAAKEIAAAVVNNEKIGLESDYPCKNLPKEIVQGSNCRTGICISTDINKKPFSVTLNLVPENIAVGIGCKRGVSADAIEREVDYALNSVGIDPRRINKIASLDLKADETGLLEYCSRIGLTLQTFTAEELNRISGEYSKSEFVESVTGTGTVCERSAAVFGKLVLRKTTGEGVAVAAAEMPFEIDFERNIK